MKSLRKSLIWALIPTFCLPSSAWAEVNVGVGVKKSPVIFVDPKHDTTIPVYALDAKGRLSKEPVTALIPGDFASLKEIRKKDGVFIIRAKDETGADIDLALDPKTLGKEEKSAVWQAAPNARVIKIGGDSSSRGVQTAGLDSAVCHVDESMCRSFEPGQDIEVEDAVLAFTTEGENPKLKWRNYYKTKDGWWVDSDNTRRVDAIWSMKDDGEECEPTSTDPVNRERRKEIEDVIDGIQKQAGQDQLETVLRHVGDCHPYKTTGDYHNDLIKGMAVKPVPALTKEERQADGSVAAVPATRADWVSIDLMARTLYGEMASCFGKGIQYPETVAKVILNRVDFNKDKPKLGTRFLSPSDSGIRNDITKVIFKDRQFSVWNRTDQARRMAMCPPSKDDENFWAGHKPTDPEKKIWREAVRIASEAVLNGESFRRRTKDLKALYYTSNFELSKSDYKPITNATIGGKAMPLSRCVQLWSAKDLKKWAPEYGRMFHPFFRQALYQVVGN
ncbi:MAG TPA: cell wall hydrolase [Pseudobdellovibrionaceae bacterium]|nr:cell wall hydrolase [Pseudobdellovibrionaceae bacterium]